MSGATDEAPLLERYSDAREAFLAGCSECGTATESFEHPERGPAGETLSLDLAEFGNPDAAAAVLVVSGTHGAEGIAGSMLQRTWLRAYREQWEARLGEDLRVLHIHAINPYGYAWTRRVDDRNVDINRNYVEWDGAGPIQNPDYDAFADLLVPPDWSEAEQQRTTQALLEQAGAMGIDRFQDIVTRGQYAHPRGLYFGGHGPSWSFERVRAFCGERWAGLEQLAVIDLHTGLGPRGFGELISSTSADHPNHRRAAGWYGDVCSQVDGDSVSPDLNGEWLFRLPDWLPNTRVTPLALEFGTVEPVRVLQALRADAWLHSYGDPIGPEAPPIKEELRRVFCDPEPDWSHMLRQRFDEVLGQAFEGLRRSAEESS